MYLELLICIYLWYLHVPDVSTCVIYLYLYVAFTCCVYLLCLPVVLTCCIYLLNLSLYLPILFVITRNVPVVCLLYLPVVHFVVLPSPAKELVGVPVHSQHLFLGHRWHAPKYGRVWQSETGQLIMIDWCVHMCNLCYMYQMCIPLKRDTLPLMISKAVGHKKSHLISF